MAISEQAQANHDELFPGRVSTLTATDPELIEYFDNFAFDEVLRHGDLDPRTRLMVQLASMIACGALGEFTVMLGAALTVGVGPVEVKEIVYQAVPYVGMARVFDFLHATNDVLVERGVELPLPGQSTTTPHTRSERGLAVQQQIIGADTVEALYATAPRTCCTSSATCPRTASETTTRARASTCGRASCSPSRCSSPWADASRRSPDTSPRTCASATAAPA
ncbi:carboxymuconolactone decarboxylase family protein [Pengzhenrongella phosphoraccumulans]